MKAIVPVVSGVEELETVTIIDVLRRGGVEVIALSIDEDAGLDVEGSRGVGLVADEMWNDEAIEDADIIILPGGMGGMEAFCEDMRVQNTISRFASNKNKFVAAICASPVALYEAGVLNGRRVTCYPGLEERMPEAKYSATDKVLVDGNIITSQGPATALMFAILILELLQGHKVANAVAEGMLIC